MGTIKRFVCSLILLGTLLGNAQEDEVIDWSSDQLLTWSDFKGKPTSDDAAANTASGITYKFSSTVRDGKFSFDFTVTSQFYPNKSWYRPQLSDAFILAHEQLHFDITEIYARKFEKLLSEAIFTANVKEEIKIMFDDINVRLYAFQYRYDNETNYSRNRVAQTEWVQKIKTMLSTE